MQKASLGISLHVSYEIIFTKTIFSQARPKSGEWEKEGSSSYCTGDWGTRTRAFCYWRSSITLVYEGPSKH